MSTPEALRGTIAAALGGTVEELRAVSGGDLSDAYRARLSGGREVFVKTAAGAAPGTYAAEAAGLRWIAGAEGAPAVPEVLAVVDPDESTSTEPRLLALQWIDRGSLAGDGAEALGRGLAALHRAGADAHGADPPGASAGLRIGPVRMPAGIAATWAEVYACYRLRPLAEQAQASGGLSRAGRAAIERVCERMPQLAGPTEPPARLHGDLWGGNVIADVGGAPYLIDPAAYGGHREVDLAMLRLFGGPGERCFQAYDEVYPLAEGHRDRVELWQLLPLLVHAILFGGGYGDRAARVARRYAG